MVISYYGALNAFLAIYSVIPSPVRKFILFSLMILAGVTILKKVSDL